MQKIRQTLLVFALLGSLGSVGKAVATQNAPQNQREFDKFALAASEGQLSVAGHAFDNGAAQLFWFTDLEAAKKQAKSERKPILSLRLLGRLSDEYSCANSRFFRVIFYPQAQINSLLRNRFVLYWSSERAVPIITIDMGDGRVIKRTLTGNSTHYLLDETGRPLDVMPGLVTPARFTQWLQSGIALHQAWEQTQVSQRETFLSGWHRAKMGEIWRELEPNSAKNEPWVEEQIKKTLELNPLEMNESARVAAEIAAPLSVAKAGIEKPILDATRLFASAARVAPTSMPNGFYLSMLRFRPQPEVLDKATRNRVGAMNPPLEARTSPEDNRVFFGGKWMARSQISIDTAEKTPLVSPLEALIARFEQSIQYDDGLSLARFQIPIHASFIQGQASDFQILNHKIYDRLFLTPQSDKWLGLAPMGTFTALQNGGLGENATSRE